jgi:CheY-like chemotaxis protein
VTILPSVRPSAHSGPLPGLRLSGADALPRNAGPGEHRERDRFRQRRLRVLVVDDEDGFGAALCAVLEKRIHVKVVQATGPREALERVETHRDVHLVLLDLLMPGMDGVEVYGRMRAYGVTARIVLMSAVDSDANRARAEALGLRLLGKPLDDGALRQILLECAGDPP